MTLELTTQRLSLRRARPDDVPRFLACMTFETAIMLASVPWPYTREDAQDWVAKQDQMWASGRHFPFALDDGSGLIGMCGLHFREPADTVPELGYWLGEPWRGRGFVREAAIAVLGHGFGALDLTQIDAGHYFDNPASARVLEALGFRETGWTVRPCRARGTDVRLRRMRLMRQDFAARAKVSP